MYGSLSRVNAKNHKALLADSYSQLLREISDNDLKTIGNYRVVKQIGQGSFGKVYLATHKFTHSKVVLKSSPKNQPHLVREIHHHRLFKHPHIARLYEVIVTDTLVWLVLEYCPGDELYSYLIKNTRLKIEDTKRMFSQLVGAVAYTHSKNCTHRDLKLENVLLDKKLNVKLCDFGFTREYEPRSMLDTVCGTTCYMAPEMLLNKKYNGELVDVWSLGVIFYTLVYGQQPFDEENDLDTKMKIITEEPEYPDYDDVSGSALDLAKAMLTKDPRQRPTLEDILNHPYLDDYAYIQKDILSAKVPKLFSTKAEKKLLRSLRSAHFDLEQLADSVMNFSCDPLAGLWALALEKEEKFQSKRSHRTSLSISKMGRKHSDKRSIPPTPPPPVLPSASTAPQVQPHKPHTSSTLPPQLNLEGGSTQQTPQSPSQYQPNSPRSPITAARVSSPLARSSVEPARESLSEAEQSFGLQPQSTPQEPKESPSSVESPSAKSSMSSVIAKTNERRREFGNSFKNAMLRLVMPAKRRREEKAKERENVLQQKDSSLATTPELEVRDFSGNGNIPRSSTENNIVLTSNNRPRPVSGISQFSQFSAYSQYSVTSQLSSAPSNASAPERSLNTATGLSGGGGSSGNFSKNTSGARPSFGRRSTSSSFSSLVSRTRRRKQRRAHSKTSSTSSASLNSSPVGSFRRPISGSAESPTLGDSSHDDSTVGSAVDQNQRNQSNGQRGRFNEAAVFSMHHRVRHMRKKSPFSSPRGSISGKPGSIQIMKSSKGGSSVIVEDEEEDIEIGADDSAVGNRYLSALRIDDSSNRTLSANAAVLGASKGVLSGETTEEDDEAYEDEDLNEKQTHSM